MEEKRNTTRVRMRAWTPASGYSSPPSPVSSQLSWDEGRDADFQSQMDENGVIGLGEHESAPAHEADSIKTGLDEDKQEDEIVLEGEEDMFSDVGTPEPEEGPPSALEDLSCHLSELLDSEPLSPPTGDDRLSPTHNGVEFSVSLEEWSDDDDDDVEEKLDEEDQASFSISRPVPHSWPYQDLVSEMSNDEGEAIKIYRDESYPPQRKSNPQGNWLDSHDATSIKGIDKSDIVTSEKRPLSQNSCDERSRVCSSLAYKSSPESHIRPHLPELNLQEEVSNFRTEDDTFAERGGSNSSQLSQSPGTCQPVRVPREKELVSELSIFESENALPKLEQTSAGPCQSNHQPPVSSPRDINYTSQVDCPFSSSTQSTANNPLCGRRRHRRPAKTSHTDMNDVRKGQLSHPLPDFSQVQPRVRFPKSTYKPPKSRKPPYKTDSKPEAPVVFKSPADIVKEALSSNSEGSSFSATVPTDSQRPLNAPMPEEFQCPLQASTMVQQLQEDYNRLLTKYAEAENTIDRLRLEAKVDLHSDPPKPSQLALQGVLKEGSKVITLSFPQAQRAQMCTDAVQPTQQRLSSATRRTTSRSSSVDSFSSIWHESPAPLTETVYKQLARFQLQFNKFEKLLKRRRLQPYEQTQWLSQLDKGLESIERTYLAARENHQQLQRQTEGKSGPFDPDRELESLIFQLGIQLEELKEWIEHAAHSQLIEPTPSDPPHAHQPCAETEPQPENPVSAPHAEVMVSLEVSSVSGGSDGDRREDEEDMRPSALCPLGQKQQRVEKDFSNLMDHCQNFRDLSKMLDRDQAEVDHNVLKLRDYSSHPDSIARIETEQQWRNKDKHGSNRPLQTLPVAAFLPSLSCSSHVLNSMETLPEASAPASPLPRKQGNERRATSSIKSHGSLGERADLGTRASKENDRALRTQLQDGVVTPETDSGFVGSESSQLTPAVQSPVQQRAAVRATRPSVTREKCRINPRSCSPAHTQPASDPSRAHAVASGGAPESRGRSKEAKMRCIPSSSTSSSALRWPSTHLQPWPSSGIGELEQQSECAHTLSDDATQQGDQNTQPSNQDPSYLRSSSLNAPYHHGDHLKAQSSRQLANHHKAIESLHAEIHRLREHLERTLRTARPSHRLRTPLSPSKDIRDHRPPHTSTPHPQQRDVRSLERKMAGRREPRESGGTVKREQEGTVPRRRSASVPRLRPEPDTSTDSDHAQSEDMTPKHIPASPVMARTIRKARVEIGRSAKAHTDRPKRSMSAARSGERNDEDKGRERPAALCLSCLARGNRTSGHLSTSTQTRYHTTHCPLCGATKRQTVAPPANQSLTQKEMQLGGVYLALAPPPPVIGSVPVLQCVPVCPSVLYHPSHVVPNSYQKPLYISLSQGKGYGGHQRRSRSVETQHSLNRSLGRAIATASSVREMSQRMVRSLSSGLHHTGPLSKSCTY